nr:putative F-box protein At3g52320 [Ipomoea batatas]
MSGASEKTAAGVSTLPLHHLPQDILVEILSKLPAKSLVGFRCLSKFFYALIADHAFGALHRTSSLTLPSRAGILIGILPRIPLIDRFPPAYYTINFSEENPRQPGMLQAKRLGFLDAEIFLRGSLRSSSDGLICLSRGHGDVAVYNVSTGKHVSLPAFKSRALLGFDSQAKRYKVLMINQPNSSNRFGNKHWIFTVGVDKSWREINYSLPHPFYPFDVSYACPSYSDTSVHIDGIIYYFNWLTIYDPPSFHIVAFEVGSESYSLIPFPVEISSSSQYQWANYVLGNFALLQVDGGRLAILLREYCLCYMNVWIWEKSKECWEKITMTIPLEESRSCSMAATEDVFGKTNCDGQSKKLVVEREIDHRGVNDDVSVEYLHADVVLEGITGDVTWNLWSVAGNVEVYSVLGNVFIEGVGGDIDMDDVRYDDY